jgi:UDPglucose--hexose-1-phosphate uridylyltransferase
MPELRIDPIVGRRVYVAEDRAGRPSDYVGESLRDSHPVSERPGYSSGCPFCAGQEQHTPVASAEVLGAEGRWQVRVVPNKFPAVMLDQPLDAAFGAHEVIIESPRHLLHWTQLDVDQLAVVLTVYRDRLRHWATESRLKHAIIFKNSGFAAGASLEHIHSQLVALPYIPVAIQAELDSAAKFRASHDRCLFCDFLQRELAAAERVVFRQEGYVAMCAYAPRQPYETWIFPEPHTAHFANLDDGQLHAQAGALRELLTRLEAVSPSVAYNLLLHTAPTDAPETAFHWHWEVVPRLTHEAGLEWGAGVFISPLSPERAADQLRLAAASS